MPANQLKSVAGTPRRSVGSQLKLAGTVLALLILVVFVALNFSEVNVDLMIAETKVRLAFALLFAGLMGFIAGYFLPKGR